MSDRVPYARFALPVLLLVMLICQALALHACVPRPAPGALARVMLTPVLRPEEGPVLKPSATAIIRPTATASPASAASPTACPEPCGGATPLPTATPTVTASPTATATATLPPAEPPSTTPTPAPTATAPVVPDGVERTARVPILMYHYISDPPAGADRIRVDLSVTPQRFEEQLRYLKDAGYSGISLSDLVRYLQDGTPLPPKPVVLTFDDGYVDNYLYAFPLLRQYGFSGTFFVITGFLDEQRPGYLSWEQAATMEKNGMDIEAHSYTHADLRNRSVDYLVWQIEGAREAIEAHLHKTVTSFCFPSGQYDAQTLAVLRSAHFVAAVTTHAGADHSTSGLLQLARVRVHGGQGMEKFVQLMEYYR